MFNGRLAAILTIFSFLVYAPVANAQLYKWVDKEGKMHFSTNRADVPKEYRKETNKLKRKPVSGSSRDLSSTVIKYQPNARAIYLNAKVNGDHQVRMLLDTGASISAIKPSVARRIDMDLTNARQINVGTGGGMIKVPLAPVQSVKLEGREVKNFPMALIPALESNRDMDGILGTDFFNQFDYTLNPSKGELILRPKK